MDVGSAPQLARIAESASALAPGAASLGRSARSTLDLIAEAREGFPYSSLAQLERHTGFSAAEIADWAGFAERTLTRRKVSRSFSADESERLLRFAVLFESALKLFGGAGEAARRWLTAPRLPLGGMSPLECARSAAGAREVERLIGRIEYGVFS